MSDRDEFPKTVKERLAQRVNYLCSNPECGVGTSGPHTDPMRAVSVGVAAHIEAASNGGPRANNGLSPESRKAISNGIWLCQTCSRLVDTDPARYSVGLLRKWKESAENRAKESLESGRQNVGGTMSDLATLKVYRTYFDRPALQDTMVCCRNYADFVAALTQLVELLNTGRVHGNQQAKSRHDLGMASALVPVYEAILKLRVEYTRMVRSGAIDEAGCMCGLHDAHTLEILKSKAVDAFNAVMRGTGLPEIRVPV
jgi:hypothetical protein